MKELFLKVLFVVTISLLMLWLCTITHECVRAVPDDNIVLEDSGVAETVEEPPIECDTGDCVGLTREHCLMAGGVYGSDLECCIFGFGACTWNCSNRINMLN